MRRKQLTLQQKVFVVKNYYQITDMFEVRKAFTRSYALKMDDKILEIFFKLVTQFELTGSVTQAVYYDSPKDNGEAVAKQELEVKETSPDVSPAKRGRKAKEKVDQKLILKAPESDEDHDYDEGPGEGEIQWNEEQGAAAMIITVTNPEDVQEGGLYKIGEIINTSEYMENDDDEPQKIEPTTVTLAAKPPKEEKEDPRDEDYQPEEEEAAPPPLKKPRAPKGSGKKARFTCPICENKYMPDHVRSHMLKHDMEGCNYECNECEETFERWGDLQDHEETHIPVERYKFKCSTCPEKFVNEVKLKVHLKKHEDPKASNTVCEICGKVILNRSSLSVHMRTHTNEKPLKCKECGESFKFEGAYKTHMKKHIGGDYKCDYCEKKFVYKAERHQHQKEHLGVKPYVCHVCQRGCITAQNLHNHMKYLHNVERTLDEIEANNFKGQPQQAIPGTSE